ncbi:MAG: SET domain-containing protein [Planctomycetota bacterium]
MHTEHEVTGIRVGTSPLGLGVFATKQFHPGEAVGCLAGRTIEDPAYESDYCIDLSNGLSLEPGGPFRFLNHSCHPNCELVRFEEDEQRRPCPPEIWVEARRRIESGNQLTIDYGWPANWAIPCLCGSRKCRGWIVAQDEAHRLPPRKEQEQHLRGPRESRARQASTGHFPTG